jgi:fructose-1,6-bisphosphatase/inositol monophosphatase family enzyme
MESNDAKRVLEWLHDVAKAVQERVDAMTRDATFGEVVGMGADGTPTLHVDHVADQVIINALEQAPIALNLVSEEAQRIDKGAEHTLLVDPIDGSRNAVRGVPFFAVSLAVGRDAQSNVEVGLVRNLATGQVYSARKGAGATLDGRPIKVRPYDEREVFVTTSLRYDPDLVEAVRRGNVHLRTMGAAALENCMVAHGAADAFVSRRPYLRIIDVAASTLIVREAGGKVLTPHGDDFDASFDVTERVALIAVGDERTLEVIR